MKIFSSHRAYLVLMCIASVLLLSGCGTIHKLLVEEYDENLSQQNANAFLDLIEAKLSGDVQRDNDLDIKTMKSIKLDKGWGHACVHPYVQYANLGLDFSNESNSVLAAIDQRYGLHHSDGGYIRYWYARFDRHGVYKHRQNMLVGDGTQVLSIHTTIKVPAASQCEWGAEYERSFSLENYDGVPVNLASMKLPPSPQKRAAFIAAAERIDASGDYKEWFEKSKAEARRASELQSARIAQENRERQTRDAAHFVELTQRLNKYVRSAGDNMNYVRQQNEINQRKEPLSSSSYSPDRSSPDRSVNFSSAYLDRAKRKEVIKTANKVNVTSSYERAMEKRSASKEKDKKGLRYTEVSIEAKGTTGMYFEYDQALDLSETNAYNAASGSCASQDGRLKEGSGTMAKKSCDQNKNDEYKCNVTMLFTCMK
ncbi:hypothetical protein [Marinobacterium rhizophilum]|uniref:Lipoprotein n=1 Tax=Marinobacterium rhizophilum TaxID=420402 RepID=A0ABY5HJI6_9GAMM|nr:hypothetical protein [Marinobacterium rhizophilum]UTW12540.1 hypothetical protein KDW95_02310 [Marinobacterium rhizophilum]